jgi:type IV pilus assembly protein PilM
MRWPATPTRTPIGIDFGGRTIKAAQLRRTGSRWRVEAAAAVPRREPNAPIRREEVERFCGVLDRQGFVGNQAVLTVPRDKILRGMLALPASRPGAPLAQIARIEFARMHGCDPQGFELAYWALPRAKRSKDKTQMLAAACRHADADPVLDAAEEGGLDVEALDVPACALRRACAPLVLGADGIVGVLDVGWNASELVVLYGGIVVYERSVPEGGIRRLYDAMSRAFALAPREIEVLLAKSGTSDGEPQAENAGVFRQIRSVVTAHVDGALAEIRAPLAYASQQYGGAPVERLLLVGGGASIPALVRHLDSVLDVQTQAVTPADLAECPNALLAICGEAGLTIAIGLAQFFTEN